ncbi:beta-galactosidase [Naasia sp. SYSU D00948]|uniref:beta-galactosidase n=1 Tax=Naasia sp. SYSU D00948 TaxID=2817379 RepID=UPI001FEFF915|nr:beta-galactosidase [Naasia sp. SYSU D00948]
MYAGGTNPARGLQESQATGYPNDIVALSYDFHAPIGEAGLLAGSYAELRRQHAFLAAFGPMLADLPSSLPDVRPSGVADRSTLRWALRASPQGGFLFLAWRQPHEPLDTYEAARFRVQLGEEELLLPSRPVDVPPGTLASWPIGLTVGGVRIGWVTASALTLLGGPVPTLVLVAQPGVPVELAVPPEAGAVGAGRTGRSGSWETYGITPGRSAVRVRAPRGAVDVLVLSAEDGSHAWVREGSEAGGERELLLSPDALTWGESAVLGVSVTGEPDVQRYDVDTREFRPVELRPLTAAPLAAEVLPVQRRPAGTVPSDYGFHDGRQSAPTDSAVETRAAVYELELPPWALDGSGDVSIHIEWAGDVAELRVDGVAVSDRFWDGSCWSIDAKDVGVQQGRAVTLHVLPLAPDSKIRLPAAADERRRQSCNALLAVDRVRMERRQRWSSDTGGPSWRSSASHRPS